MALTPDFKQAIQSSASMGNTGGGTVPGQPMTPEQFQAWAGAPSAPTNAAPAQPGYLQRTASAIGGDISNAAKTLQPYVMGERPIGGIPLSQLGKETTSVAKDITSPAWEPLAQAVGPAVQAGTDLAKPLTDKISDIPALQGFMGHIDDLVRAHPDATAIAGNLVQTFLNMFAPEKAGTTAADVATKTKEAVAPGATMKDAVDYAKNIPDKIRAADEAANVEKLKDQKAAVSKEWQSPAIQKYTTNPAQFNLARKVLASNPEAPDLLTDLKLHPAQHVENGRYTTLDRALQLRDDSGQISRDFVRPLLEHASYTTPKAPIEAIRRAAIENITKDPLVTGGEEKAVMEKINKEASILKQKYPDGMSLSNMEDKKIAHGSRGGFNADGSIDANNTARAHRNISFALSDAIQSRAPREVSDLYSAAKDYQSKLYGAADYLSALNNKKAPVTSVAAVARKSARIGGFLAGHAMGGGVLPGVAGYALGGTLESFAENMLSAHRGSFLQALAKSNPEALTAIKKFMTNEEQRIAETPRLGPGKPEAPLGSPENPHLMPKEDTGVGPVAVPAGKYPVTANPSTGKFQKGFTSTGESISPEEYHNESEGAVTSFRGTPVAKIADTAPLYNTPRAKGFANSLMSTGDNFGVTVGSVNKTPGSWEGKIEPSFTVKFSGKMDDKMAYMAAHGAKGNQDAFIVFTRGNGAGMKYSFTGLKNPDKALATLHKQGIQGATIDGNEIRVYDTDGSLAEKLSSFSKELSVEPKKTKGDVRLVFKDDYGKYTGGRGVGGGLHPNDGEAKGGTSGTDKGVTPPQNKPPSE